MKRLVLLAFVVAACGGKPAPAPAPAPAVVTPVPAAAPAAPTGPVVPATAAGTLFQAWLDVFNSADAARMKAFVDRHGAPAKYLDGGFRAQTGGFVLVSIEKNEPRLVSFVVKEKASDVTALGSIEIGADGKLAVFKLRAIPRGLTAKDMTATVDGATRDRVVDKIVATLAAYYVYPDTAKKMGAALKKRQPEYATVDDAQTFAETLTEHLREVSKDKHLLVAWTPSEVPADDRTETPEDKTKMRTELEQAGCFFSKTEKLDGDIGYLKFDAFMDVEVCGPKVTEAFAALGNVKALIVDLRENGGGQPDMVAFISSYLFAKRTHLNDLYDRKANKTTQYWTKVDVPGTKLAKQPVYVLTSARTFSGAEEFAYNLKALKRATIIGETTGGGAHPTMMRRLDAHYALFVPFARAINPITKKNWEGTGVEPDVKVPADQALETAKQLAAKK